MHTSAKVRRWMGRWVNLGIRQSSIWWRRARTLWRGSLQLRVVATTLLVSALVTAILGVLLMSQITRGLVDTKRSQAIAEAKSGQRYTEQQLQTLGDPSDPAIDATLRTIVVNLSARGTQTSRFAVAIRTENPRLPGLYVAQYEPHRIVIPSELATMVRESQSLTYQYVRTSLNTSPPRPFLIVGALIRSAAGEFELYYFFPLDTEADTVDLVRKGLLGTGMLLVISLAGISWVVTRQVVTPVRVAARTAERLSAGLLEERMQVRGEDDLARLAQSFNQMAANLQSQIVQLEDLSRLQRRFTSDVSHELRTPLTTVRMAADVLYSARADFPGEVARSAELLNAELDRFEALLADLLEISRYDSGFAVLEAEPTNLATLITQVVSGLATLAQRNEVSIQISLPNDPVIVDVDARRIERILRNLIGNALEYADRKPVIVRLAANENAAAIAVRDYGVGFRSEDTEAVFNRFWRADPSRARQTGGTGLGLSIAHEDARLHGGTLRAWSAPGAGSQFVLTVPRQADGLILTQPLPVQPSDAGVSIPPTEKQQP